MGASGLFGGGPSSRPALLEPVAFAVHLQDVDMVGDAVEQRAGEALAGEDRGPFLEGQVRGDDCGAVFVAAAEDVEQQLASALREGHVSEFVDDRQADPGELVLEAEKRRRDVNAKRVFTWRRQYREPGRAAAVSPRCLSPPPPGL